jgi:hypothetical protein
MSTISCWPSQYFEAPSNNNFKQSIFILLNSCLDYRQFALDFNSKHLLLVVKLYVTVTQKDACKNQAINIRIVA